MNSPILLVDDDNDLLETFEETLTLRGYDVVTANNGENAIEVYKEKQPCITFMDIQMPKMDGYEAFSKIKKMYKDAKIIFITGHLTDEKTRIAKTNGLVGVLNKPSAPEQIINVIKENNC